MKQVILLYLLVLSIVFCLTFSGCVESGSENQQTTASNISGISVTDSDGNILTFDKPPQRIVITGGNIAEVLVMIGAQNQIVGVGDTVKNDPRLASYLTHAESVGDYSVPNMEKIISLNPDLLLCYSSDKPKSLDLLKKTGVPIGFFDCYKQNSLSEEVRKLGVLTGKTVKADQLSGFIDSMHALVKNRVDNSTPTQRPSVYYETGSDYTAAATNSGGDWLITTAGGRNIVENSSIQWVKVTPEWIILQNPDVIIKLGNDDNESSLDGTRKTLLNRTGFSDLKAARLNRTYVLSHKILYGPQSVIGLVYIARIIHPELFSDVDPESYLNQFSLEFLHEANMTRVIYPVLE